MKWFYVENGQQVGPVEESQLAELVQSGKLRGDTLVWHEGMAAWQAFSTVCPPELATVVGAAPSAASASGGGGETTETACAECGNIFRREDMIPHQSVFICANCKPVFMQKLAEGAKIRTGALEYASIGTRFGAVILDGLILWVVSMIIQFGSAGLVASSSGGSTGPILTVQLILMGVQLLIAVLYETLMVGKFGATLGKMACKIKVVTADGGRVSYLRALGRHFAKILSQIICFIGYLMAIFDKEERRALHDRICNTRVVLK